MRTAFSAIASLVGICAIAHANQPIPPEAIMLIEQVHSAAYAKNYTFLKSVMTNDFTWSFGADKNTSSRAIEAWRVDPTYLKRLEQATGQQCARTPEDYIECPKNAGMDYRAGFKRLPDGWRMVYFVAGD